jgi:hypothetical protein
MVAMIPALARDDFPEPEAPTTARNLGLSPLANAAFIFATARVVSSVRPANNAESATSKY